jgi:hypothetical protein
MFSAPHCVMHLSSMSFMDAIMSRAWCMKGTRVLLRNLETWYKRSQAHQLSAREARHRSLRVEAELPRWARCQLLSSAMSAFPSCSSTLATPWRTRRFEKNWQISPMMSLAYAFESASTIRLACRDARPRPAGVRRNRTKSQLVLVGQQCERWSW